MLSKLKNTYEREGQEEDVRRLADLLQTNDQEFTWWQSLNPETDRVLSSEDWVPAMRMMLGAPLLVGDSICGACGLDRLDAKGYHALCCARAQSTIGHNRARDCLAEMFWLADPSTSIEVPGLCPSAPTLRPADILTRAGHATKTLAVDVGIAAPHAAHAGSDAAETMRETKLDKYEPYSVELDEQGITYAPATFTAYGRRHPCATNMLKTAATKVARRKGLESTKGLLRCWQRQLAAEIWRRAARMTKACMPTRLRKGDQIGSPTQDGEDDDDDDDDEDQKNEASTTNSDARAHLRPAAPSSFGDIRLQ